MILGTGIDMVEIERIAHSIERYGTRFLERVYTPGEIAYCQRKRRNAAESFAARFAAKEAAAKALGTGHRLRGDVAGDRGGPRARRPAAAAAARPRSGDRPGDGRASQLALHHAHQNGVNGAG